MKISDLKIGVIVPTRGDRHEFLKQCKKMINYQTIKPIEVFIVDYVPNSDQKDITRRYRIGYDHFRNRGLDCILLMEDDDYYAPNYIETMLDQWLLNGKPDLLGTDHTIYYNINIKKYLIMHHLTRSSAMSTLIKPDLNFKWGPDNEPYTDVWLWKELKNKKIFVPSETICMGIKHGIGLCGGYMHYNKLERYKHDDNNLDFLKEKTKREFNFYKNLINC